MARRTIEGSRAIVTGASSGIGRELARQLAAAGALLVISARREDRLRQLAAEIAAAGGRAECVAGDIADPAVRAAIVAAAQSAYGGLDILVNNAGVGAQGLFAAASPERLRRVMEVNFFAPVELTRLCLPLLERGKRPILVNVSSIQGRRGVPHNTEYSASKFALHGFSESLRAELAGRGIDVLVVSPGRTETEFFDSVLEQTSTPNWPRHWGISAAAVARQTIGAIRSGRHEIVPYFYGKVLLWLNRISPRLVDTLMARYA
ncbi:MAG: SDR family oxidoreductase [Thermoguttaceae bacterium]|jgi:short-subunit dehydrogenase